MQRIFDGVCLADRTTSLAEHLSRVFTVNGAYTTAKVQMVHVEFVSRR